MKTLAIIPAYNEAESILSTVNALKIECPDVDYIVINDGSMDDTASICRANGLNRLDLPLNLGIGGAVQTGYLYAVDNNYDVVIQIDGDGQHDPAYVNSLVSPIVEGRADFVIGSRFIETVGFQSSTVRRFGIKILSIVINFFCGYKPSDATSGFRATNREVAEFFSETYAHDYPEPEAILSSVLHGFTVMDVPVRMMERIGGSSSISGFKSIHYMLKVSLSLLFSRVGVNKVKK